MQVAVWDLAVERDPEEEATAVAEATTALPPPELPPQLMFVHQVSLLADWSRPYVQIDLMLRRLLRGHVLIH